MSSKTLCVFDFDDTVINCNSDTYIYKLMPNGNIPDELRKTFDGVHWTRFMRNVFKYMFEQGIQQEDYAKVIKAMPFVDGIKELLEALSKATNADGTSKFELIIISDANKFFIETFLNHHGLRDAFSKIFTNPAQFDPNGMLTIQEYHIQDFCRLSAVNMCKGHILRQYVADRSNEGQSFDTIVYVGDGQNDLCPGLILRSNDVLCPRAGYSLSRILDKKDPDIERKLQAKQCIWKSGLDILAFINSEQNRYNEGLTKAEQLLVLSSGTTGGSNKNCLLPASTPKPIDEVMS